MNNLISIIVPVYNAEAYLEKCVESLINQTYRNIEIILINDGSNDSSERICLKFANEDKRVKYFKQSNSGAAAARNKGLDNASGNYIGFVDSDDFVDEDMFEVLLKFALDNDADASQILSRRVTDEGNIINQQLINVTENTELVCYNSNQAIEHYLLGNHSLWSHLYRASLFNDLRIPEGMSGEDLAIIIPLYSKVNKVVKINQYKYNYRYNTKSVTNSKLNQRSINLYYEYKNQITRYYNNQYYVEILTYTQFKTLNGIINSIVLFGDRGFDNNEEYFKKELKINFPIFQANKFISLNQIRKIKLYLFSRSIYKSLLRVKRKYYKRPLYGEE